MEIQNIKGHNCCLFGNGKINLVIEIGLGASIAEWWHIPPCLSKKLNVLLYERSRNTSVERSPENIARELQELLSEFDCEDKIIFVAHSQGGLYAFQFAESFPERVKGLVLLDPLSPFDNIYKDLLNPEEQKKSGFDKSKNLAIMYKLAKFHLGFINKAIMKKAPPFYYYDKFSKEAKDYILNSFTKPDIYAAAMDEYRLAHDENYIHILKNKEKFSLSLPLVLVTHTSEFSIEEIMEFGQASRDLAEKVEAIWQSVMMEYLSFSNCTTHIRAKNSGHYMHLTEPELISDAINWINNK